MKFEIYRELTAPSTAAAPDGQPMGDWRWRLRADNGRIVAEGGEGYKQATAMVKTLHRYITLDTGQRLMLTEALGAVGLNWYGKKLAKRG